MLLESKCGNILPLDRMPASTFAKEYFDSWVVTRDPLLTSAKWVAYCREVQAGNPLKTHDFSLGLCTGIDDSTVLFGVFILCEPRGLEDILCVPHSTAVSLHLLGESFKTDSPSFRG